MNQNSKVSAVLRGLRHAIISQALAPGAKLPEDAVGESFGVSRTVVRIALTQLASEGLVDIRHKFGAAVASPTLAEAHDVFAVRRGLERIVIEVLAARFTKAEAERLLVHVAAEDGARDGAESIRLAGEFHTLLAEATGNGILTRYVAEVVSRCSLILALYGRPHSSECAVTEHREIIAALVAGDVGKAVRVMDEHLGAVVDRALLDHQAERSRDIREILTAFAERQPAKSIAKVRRARQAR
jgi:DNA-binding GntR family transcriptional regulator